jgi:hypothetical protein
MSERSRRGDSHIRSWESTSTATTEGEEADEDRNQRSTSNDLHTINAPRTLTRPGSSLRPSSPPRPRPIGLAKLWGPIVSPSPGPIDSNACVLVLSWEGATPGLRNVLSLCSAAATWCNASEWASASRVAPFRAAGADSHGASLAWAAYLPKVAAAANGICGKEPQAKRDGGPDGVGGVGDAPHPATTRKTEHLFSSYRGPAATRVGIAAFTSSLGLDSFASSPLQVRHQYRIN